MEKLRSILIAEGGKSEDQDLKDCLESFGYDVDWVRGGAEAIKKITSNKKKYLLVLSDQEMDEVNGFDLLSFVRADPFYIQCPFILMSDSMNNEDKIRAFTLKVSEFIQKPIKPQELELRVKNLLSLSNYQERLSNQNFMLNSNLLEKSKLLEKKLADYQGMYLELKETQERLIEAEKHSTLAVVGGGIAHEFNTPLSVISMCASQMEIILEDQGVEDPKIKKMNSKIIKATEKISDLVTHIRNYAHPTDILKEKELVNLRKDIELALHDTQRNFESYKIEIDVNPEMEILVNKLGITKVIISLLENAYDANKESGKEEIYIKYKREENNNVLAIEDRGPGIPADQMFNVFIPFFTLKEVGEGRGLGLSLANNFCRAMDIELQLENVNNGLRAKLIWSDDE